LEAVELLSILEEDSFINYAKKLNNITEEAYQHEAITVAIQRYKKLRD